MAHAVRGLLLLPVYSGGFSAMCPICYFNAPTRRFNAWRLSLYRLRPARPVAGVYGLMAWCFHLLRGLPRSRCAARLPPPLVRRCFAGWRPAQVVRSRPAPAARSRGPPAADSPCVDRRQSRRQSRRESRESRWHSRSAPGESRCHSRRKVAVKVACVRAKVARFTPKS